MTQAHPAGVQVAALPVGPAGPRCQCVKRHVPQPAEEEVHHIVPVGAPFHGPDVADNRTPLCPTQHSSVHFLIRIYLKARAEGRELAGAEVAHFNPLARRLARRAIDWLDGIQQGG
jgi:hypothetical protein